MSQASLTISDGTGAAVLLALNNALAAVGSYFYGATDPATSGQAIAGMWWADSGHNLIQQRNAANTAWVPKGTLLADGTINWYVSPGINANLVTAINEAEVTLASASTMAIGAALGNLINVTGTTGITAFDIVQAGTYREFIANGTLTITYNATSMILPGSTNLTLYAGDVIGFRSLGGGNWKCVLYEPVGAWNLQGQKITSLATGVNPTDAANVGQLPAGVPTGTLIHALTPNTPNGYLKPNGAALSRTVYNNLMTNSFCTIGTTGTVTSGSAVITGIPSTIYMGLGMPVEGAGISVGATIASINSLTSITLSANATATASSETITVFPFGNGDGATTFNVPDLRGEHLRNWDDSRGVDLTALQGVVTSGSVAITGLSYTGFMYIGMPVSGSGIPAGATVASITSATAITISASATASATTALTFTGRRFGSWENHDFLSHNHTVNGSYFESSGGPSTYPAGSYAGMGSIIVNNTGGAETRGRNYAVPVYIKY